MNPRHKLLAWRSPTALVLLSAWTCALPLLGAQIASPDYSNPPSLKASISAPLEAPRELLFRSQRTAVQTGNMVNVTCDYTAADGTLAVRDRIVYRDGQLVSFEEEILQTGEKGRAVVEPHPAGSNKSRVRFEYQASQDAKKNHGAEDMTSDTLVDDMIPGFLQSNWDALARGSTLKFRYIVLSRTETVGFRLTRESPVSWRGIPALRVRMEPASVVIRQLVDPLYFVVEREAPHRILEYTGRTTPLVRSGQKWVPLDAVTVFHWETGTEELAQAGARLPQ